MSASLELLTHLLPKTFDFYHLGNIALSDTRAGALSEDRAALAYNFRGDFRAALVILLDPELDLSMYSEAGNIIASKLATELADKHEIDVVISPPVRLEKSQLELLAKASTEVAKKTYIHAHKGREIVLEALIFSHSPAARTQAAVAKPAPELEGTL